MKTTVKHIHHRLAAAVLFAVLALALAGCSRDEFADDPAATNDPANSRELVQVSFRARVDQPQTRAGFVPNYGINETTGDVDWTMGEKFEWKAGDEISLFIEGIKPGAYNKFTIDKIDGGYATFTGSIPTECLGQKKTIYALSPFNELYVNSTSFDPKITTMQNGEGQLCMWAKLENFDIPSDGNLSDAVLNFRHLTSLLRFHVKNTDTKGNTYSLVSIQMAEEGSKKQLYLSTIADLTSENPVLGPRSATSSVNKIKLDISSSQLGQNQWAESCVAIPPQTPRTTMGDKIVLTLVLQDKNGNYLSRKIEIDHTSSLLQKSLKAGQRYYFNIAINSDNVSAGLKEEIIEVTSPGSLFIIPGTKKITITGTINGSDLRTMISAIPFGLREINLGGADITEDLTFLGFNDTDLTSIVFPRNLETIWNQAFSGSALTSNALVIPEGIKRIGVEAFRNCPNLTGTLTLPSTLETIGERAFSSFLNPRISKVKILKTGSILPCLDPLYPEYEYPPFSPNVTIYVPMALLNAYKTDPDWSDEWAAFTFIGYDENTPAPF
jgi:BspA type Leucine rich repeat region (6 copies)/Fimbrillin-like